MSSLTVANACHPSPMPDAQDPAAWGCERMGAAMPPWPHASMTLTRSFASKGPSKAAPKKAVPGATPVAPSVTAEEGGGKSIRSRARRDDPRCCTAHVIPYSRLRGYLHTSLSCALIVKNSTLSMSRTATATGPYSRPPMGAACSHPKCHTPPSTIAGARC